MRKVRRPTERRRGVLVEVPPGSGPDVAWCWLLRRPDGSFALQYRGHDNRLLPGSGFADPGRPLNLAPGARNRPHFAPEVSNARAKQLEARMRARAQVEQDEEPWSPPILPELRLPKTPEGTRRLLAKIARKRRQMERVAAVDIQVEQLALPPNQVPMTLEEGMTELNRRHELAVLRARYPGVSDETLNLF